MMNRLTVMLLSLSFLFAAAQPAGDPEAAAFRDAFLAGDLSWERVLERARQEGEVRWFHWGGSDELNSWIDSVVVPDMAALGVRLRTTRLPNIRDAIDLVIADAGAGRGIGQGAVDALWINGENFYTLATQGLNFGAFADRVPNALYFHFDPENPASRGNLFDFGFPTNLEEIPWSGDQYLCFIDTRRLSVEDAPADFAELEGWLRDNPGRFTYVRPPHFDGNTFVQTVLYSLNPEDTGFEPFNLSSEELGAERFAELAAPAFAYLRRLEPFLLGGGGRDAVRGNPIYPQSTAALEALFINGEIDMGCRFGLYNTAVAIEAGRFPETTQNILFPREGMIRNKNFIGIPLNAPNPAAALVLANYLASPENQLSKLEAVGYPLGIDADLLSDVQRAEVERVAPSLAGLSYEALAAAAVPDTNASLVRIIEGVWLEYIERQSGTAFEDIVRNSFQ